MDIDRIVYNLNVRCVVQYRKSIPEGVRIFGPYNSEKAQEVADILSLDPDTSLADIRVLLRLSGE